MDPAIRRTTTRTRTVRGRRVTGTRRARPVRRYRRGIARISRPLNVVGANFGGFAKTAMCTMRYVDNLPAPNGAASTVDTYFFSCNGIFDPNISGGGGQPMGRDQWAAVYNHYVVTKSRIMAFFSPEGNTPANQLVVGITIDDEGALSDNATTTMMERGDTKFKIIPESNTANGKITTLKHRFHSASHFSRTNITDNDQDLGAAVGSNPTEQAYYCIWTGGLGDDIGIVNVCVVLEYTVIWSEPKDFPIS